MKKQRHRLFDRIPSIKISRFTLGLLVLLAVLEDRSAVLVPLAAMLCHEFGHIIAMRILKVGIRSVEITPFGAEIKSIPKGGMTLFEEILIFSSGATANIICAAVALPLQFYFFSLCSIALAVINLLPISSLDGGCIFEAIVVRLFPISAYRITSAVSAVFIFIVWLAATYLMLLAGGNISLFIFCIYMFISLFLKEEA